MDKGEEGKWDSLWKEGITAQSNPSIIQKEGIPIASQTWPDENNRFGTALLWWGLQITKSAHYVMLFGIFRRAAVALIDSQVSKW